MLESVSQLQSNTLAFFNEYNVSPLTTPRNGAVPVNGTIFAQIGSRERFVGGDFDVTMDTLQGFAKGTIGFLSMNGPDTQQGLLDLGTRLTVTVTQINGTRVTGSITGEFSDEFAFDRQYSEEFLVDAMFEGMFVDTSTGRTGFVGIIEGTIDAEVDGLDTFKGIIEAIASPF